MRVNNIGQHFPTMGEGKKTKPLELVHLYMFGPIRDVVLMEDSTSIRTNLEVHLSERNEAPMVVGVEESLKSSLFDVNGILMSVRSKWSTHKATMLLVEWYKNHILSQHGKNTCQCGKF